MTFSNLLIVAACPAICVLDYLLSRNINKGRATDRDSANSLVVLSGILAALAILVPLGASLLPDRHFAWPAWLLVGALLTGVLCIFGTVYSMIGLQDRKTFKPNAAPHVPCWINATWFALFALALSSVALKSLPAADEKGTDSAKDTPYTRFVVARDLPELGSTRKMIETKWGLPSMESDSGILYRTKEGVIVFCLDPKGVAQSIRESKGIGANAVGPYCK